MSTNDSLLPRALVRDQMSDFLRRELFGPSPDAADARETILNTPPHHRYLVGTLFPQLGAPLLAEDDGTGASLSEDDLAPVAPAPIAPAPEETMWDDADERAAQSRLAEMLADHPLGQKRDVGEEIEEAELPAHATFPSSMGFSSLVEVWPNGFLIRVRGATFRYESVKVAGENGRGWEERRYHRQPFEAILPLGAAELESGDVALLSKAVVVQDDDGPRLEVRVVSRLHEPRDEEQGLPSVRLLTVSLVNTREAALGYIRSEACVFSCELELCPAPLAPGDPEDASAPFLEYLAPLLCDARPQHEDDDASNPALREYRLAVEEEASLALLYRHRRTFAVGHGCAAHWTEWQDDHGENTQGRAVAVRCDALPSEEIFPIVPRELDGVLLSMRALSDLGDESELDLPLRALCDQYEAWMEEREREARELDSEFEGAAQRHFASCRRTLERMRAGVELLQSDDTVRRAFRLANRAMLMQQLGARAARSPRKWTLGEGGLAVIEPATLPDLNQLPPGVGVWRPFQLAFLLLNLRSMAFPRDEERELVDLIWFPTGGGKTEAYLALCAYTIILRRLRRPDDAGTSVLMRYTLRLLTADQFRRASSLVCALELLRRDGDVPGSARFTLGLWVGSALTPNTRVEANKKLNELVGANAHGASENPFGVLACPRCGAQMGPFSLANRAFCKGYKQEGRPARVVFRCEAPGCEFAAPNEPLPLNVVDEELYLEPPTILIGTVDKFATLPWIAGARARSFFGLHDESGQTLPPDLVIQDELHLIAGPLGSVVGHFETAIAALCGRKERVEGKVLHIGPKIVASTATISRAASQCHALWNCGLERVCIFPPQGLRAGDSFFACEDASVPGRRFLGIYATGASSGVRAQSQVYAALLQAVPLAQTADERERDYYWTLVGYFNTLRELGQTATMLQSDVAEDLVRLHGRLGLKEFGSARADVRRWINNPIELTSRISSASIPELLAQLFVGIERNDAARWVDRAVDVCLATNMISVGVDVGRLGLMVVSGQPKTTSEYIQATSRVGREKDGPGLVVMLYANGRPRDCSHYERFHSYHSGIYRFVEPTSVTPFSPPVRERVLHAVLTTLARYRAAPDAPKPVPPDAVFAEIHEWVRERVGQIDPDEVAATLQLLDERVRQWKALQPSRYGQMSADTDPVAPLMYIAGNVPQGNWDERAWPTMNSMRNVDATANAAQIKHFPRPSS